MDGHMNVKFGILVLNTNMNVRSLRAKSLTFGILRLIKSF